MTNGLAPASKTMLFTSVFGLSEMLVVVETSKVAVSNGPLGTLFGVQLAGVFQSPEVGLRFQVALPAWAGAFMTSKSNPHRSRADSGGEESSSGSFRLGPRRAAWLPFYRGDGPVGKLKRLRSVAGTAHPCISRNPALRLSRQADKRSIVRHDTRSGSLCPKLVAHLLDLCGLRFEGCLKLRNGCFQFLHLAMLFEKLIEQHRVHRFIAHGVRFSFFVAGHQIGVHLLHLLGHEAELRDTLRVKLLSCSGT